MSTQDVNAKMVCQWHQFKHFFDASHARSKRFLGSVRSVFSENTRYTRARINVLNAHNNDASHCNH